MSESFHVIHPDARIGENVQISPLTYIAADVEIGDGTVIMPNATILDGARIGKNCVIFPGAVISAIPQDLKYKGENSTTVIGDNTTIRECVTINKGTADRMCTNVGKNCLLMAYTHIAHDVTLGDHCILANMATIAGHVQIADHVTIEGLVAIQQFIQVGAYAFIAGGSKVRKNIPPYVKAARDPLGYAGVNAIGMRRKGLSDDLISRIENLYRILFVQSTNLAKAITMAEEQIPDFTEKHQILDFIKASEKGVIRGLS